MDHPAMRVSDDEREETVELLHRHLVAGRITAEEFEDRVGETWSARVYGDLDHALRGLPARRQPPQAVVAPTFVAPQGNGNATASLVLGIVSLVVLVLSLGVAAILSLPLSCTAWILARDALRPSPTGFEKEALGRARAGRILGIVGTVLSTLALGGCAVLVGTGLALF